MVMMGQRTEVTVSRIEDGALERSGEAEVGPLPPRPWHLRHGHTGSQNTGVTLCYRGWSLFTSSVQMHLDGKIPVTSD